MLDMMRIIRTAVVLLLVGMSDAEPSVHIHRHLRTTPHNTAVRTTSLCAMCAAGVGHAVIASHVALLALGTPAEELSQLPARPAVDDVLRLAVSRAPPVA